MYETGFSIQSLEKIPLHRCSIVADQIDSFYDIEMESVRPKDLIELTDTGEYPYLDFAYLRIVHRCSIVADQIDSFYDIEIESVRPTDLIEPTDTSEYP